MKPLRRRLRRQLIALLDQARRQHRIETMPVRLTAALVHDFQRLLPEPGGKRTGVALRSRTVSHGELHRHVLTIRCPDQAFYLDAIKGYLLRLGVQPIAQQTMVARMACDETGCDIELREPDARDEDNFMFIALHLSATLMPNRRRLHRDMDAVLRAVDLSVRDFEPMSTLVADIARRLQPDATGQAELLAWLNDDHYLYYGILLPDRRLGVFRNQRVAARIVPGLIEQIERVSEPDAPALEWLSLTASRHHLYSTTAVEIVRVAWRDGNGAVRHAAILGHFSRSARYMNASRIPLLDEGWRRLARRELPRHSAFYRREMRTLYDRMPNRLLLATPIDAWFEPLKAIVDLAGPLQVSAHHLPARSGNMDHLIIAIAADRYGPKVRHRMATAIARTGLVLHGHESFGVGPHRIIFFAFENDTTPDMSRIRDAVRESIVFWKDLARAEILRHPERLRVPDALRELEDLPDLYQDLFPPAQFVRDLLMRERLRQTGRTQVRLTMRDGDVRVLIYSRAQPSLGHLVDRLRAFDLDPLEEAALPFGAGDTTIHISAIQCRLPESGAPHGRAIASEDMQRLRHALDAVFNDEADHDRLNALLLRAGLALDEVGVLILLRNHLVQIAPEAALLPLTGMMLRHPETSARLFHLFAARHMPGATAVDLAHARRAFDDALNRIDNLTDDRWFRALADLVETSLRTNAWAREAGQPLAVKIDPRKLDFAPHPRPWRVVFVHGVHVEGVHLRAGPVARGGIRHSDRPSDFRTEVLELMATQVVKNGQIVPTGAKGGFVTRGGEGPAFVLAQYRAFIRALLDITDNLVDGEPLPPPGIRVPPEDAGDPYLVVAADKGTARFSDDANEESRLAGFWLDDAFASGGRHGYDHKAVGITARGAWVCAAHHFQAIGMDAWREPIRCVGIGDMSGDVFGNGMLLNPNLRLIAAFNHRHVFLDPDPDPVRAFAERKRLFAAAAGWDAYDPQCISAGGGVFDRRAKRIPLSRQARAALGIEAEALSGEALIRAILTAPVDMLYNGGIGTYVKARAETHAEVHDPANNSVRVDAADLRCKVVCEGGNLGFTQRARIEFATAGGRINTDAMDNAAGVNMSDREVNLKILFAATPGARLERGPRNRLLRAMTEAVTDLCLHDNGAQARALTLAEQDAAAHPPRLQRLRDTLLREGWLDESISPGIADDATLALRPQLSVLMGQEKNRIHARLNDEGLARNCALAHQLLHDYFPRQVRRRYGTALPAHPLADEIVHTQAANHVVNHLGLGAVHHLESLLDKPVGAIVGALLVADRMLEADRLRAAVWQHVRDLDLATGIQHALQEHLLRFAEELLRLAEPGALAPAWIERQRKGLRTFRHSLAARGVGGMESSRFLTMLKQVSELGLDTAHAAHLAAMPELAQSACAVHLADVTGKPLRLCLRASQVCLHLLPLEALEAPLRSPDWGGRDAHALRREWLNRLSRLKKRAILQLLDHAPRRMMQAGEALWHVHPFWPEIQAFVEDKARDTDAESRRLRLLLALSRLETIVAECPGAADSATGTP
ncbi:MAG: NAD-glutamate dehydrogenase [Mariprofundaceae bacterium]